MGRWWWVRWHPTPQVVYYWVSKYWNCPSKRPCFEHNHTTLLFCLHSEVTGQEKQKDEDKTKKVELRVTNASWFICKCLINCAPQCSSMLLFPPFLLILVCMWKYGCSDFREPLKGIKGKKEDQRRKECDSSSRWKDPMSIRIVGGVKLPSTHFQRK